MHKQTQTETLPVCAWLKISETRSDSIVIFPFQFKNLKWTRRRRRRRRRRIKSNLWEPDEIRDWGAAANVPRGNWQQRMLLRYSRIDEDCESLRTFYLYKKRKKREWWFSFSLSFPLLNANRIVDESLNKRGTKEASLRWFLYCSSSSSSGWLAPLPYSDACDFVRSFVTSFVLLLAIVLYCTVRLTL